MRPSRIAAKVLEEVFYDPVYHGRTLNITGQYRKLGYSAVVFDFSLFTSLALQGGVRCLINWSQ